MTSNVVQALIEDNAFLRAELETVQESLNEFSERVAEVQWTLMGVTSEQWTLANAKQVSTPLVDLVHSNPLLSRAIQLRHAYTYGDGIKIHTVTRAQTAIENQANQDAFFSSQAALTRLSARASDGNLFYLVNRQTRQVIHVPLAQITGIITDDMDTTQILFIRREWNNGPKRVSHWFRAHTNPSSHSQPAKDDLGNATFNGKWVMVHRAYNRVSGSALGTPDAMAVFKWAEAYTEYLTNQSRLVRAYSRIAGRVMRDRTPGTNKEVAAELSRAKESGTYGHTVVGDFQHLPATGSQVNFENGRSMAAVVAAGLGIGVDALLSGTVGATKSVSDMLDLATSAAMKVLQNDEEELYRIILDLLGAPNAEVDFPTFNHDPLYRVVASVSQAAAQGFIWREEAREILMDWFNVREPNDGLPEPDGFNNWAQPHEQEKVDPVPRQGNSGAAGPQLGSSNDARDNGDYDD